MRKASGLEAVQRDFSPQGVRFFYVYKTLAHPETNQFVRPFTQQERLMHVREAKQRLDTRFTWLCDTMANDVRIALGDAPNSEFVIDPDGVLVRKRLWSDPQQLREDLTELVGPVEHPTETVEIEFRSPEDDEGRPAAGVLERVRPESSTVALSIEPVSSEHPHYVKLRAEADDSLLETGEGQMYLGFHIDPIHRVHWNNQSDPPYFELELPEGVRASPQAGSGPRMEVKADIDPREFLIAVSGFADVPLRLKFRYVACDDDQTFCVPVEQAYKIFRTADPDGGWVFDRGGPPTRPETAAVASEVPESDTHEPPSASSSAPVHFEGRIKGRIDGQVHAWLSGRFHGRVEGTFQDAHALINGQLDGKIEGRFQGLMAGEFAGDFRGHLGAN